MATTSLELANSLGVDEPTIAALVELDEQTRAFDAQVATLSVDAASIDDGDVVDARRLAHPGRDGVGDGNDDRPWCWWFAPSTAKLRACSAIR